MTTASEIIATARNANDADAMAQKLTDDLDQYWDHREATLYTFKDGSVLWVSGGQLNAYPDRLTADRENPVS